MQLVVARRDDAVIGEMRKRLVRVIPFQLFRDRAERSGVPEYVEESRAGAIALNQEADVRLRSLPAASFKGRVARIGIESDRVTEERRVWVKCEDCPKDFHLGEQAEVIITAAILESALMVPEAAILGFDGHGGKVWTLDNGTARQIAVSFGLRTLDGRVEVTGGLLEGAQIVVDPPDGIRDGRALAASGVAGQ